MPITIQEIIASDTISQFVDKTNFNFDQLLLNGGGPGGPSGPIGPTGPGGGRGPKGSTWYEDVAISTPGNNPNTVSPTATPFNKDYYLQFNGQVWEYNGTTAVWEITTIDLQGPPGSAGGGGGFGLTIGAPTISQSNIRYNGPIGDNGDGANTTNEGVPSVLIGGVTSQTSALTNPVIPFTGAYIVPDAIITGNSSYETSLLIHQKDSQSRGIVFHGGAATGLNENFEQNDPSQLSNIRLDVDDTLVLSVPKAPANTPSVQTQLLGFQVLTPNRAQQFFAGSDISIQSGTGPGTVDFANQHSNIEINVGLGGSGGAGSLFRTVTQGSISTTLLEAGNSGRIPLVTHQELQTGNWQVQAGEIRMLSSETKDLRLYSGKDLRLNTLNSGGSSLGTGSIVLSAGVGGINLNSTNSGDLNGSAENIGFTAIDEVSIFAGDNMGLHAQDDMTIKVDDGNMTISQLFSTSDSTTNGRNIAIKNEGLPKNAFPTTAQTVGQITLRNNTQIILALNGSTVQERSMPSIVIDQNYSSSGSKVLPHTRFVGQQTWQRDAFQGATNTGGILYPGGDSPAQYNALEGLVTNGKNFRQTGNSNLIGISPGVAYELWSGGVQTTGVNVGVDAGTIKIFQGKELDTDSQYPDNLYKYAGTEKAYDSSLTFSVRDDAGVTATTKQFFSTNSNKTAIGNPFVLNRTQSYNTNTSNIYNGNTNPFTTGGTGFVANTDDPAVSNFPTWGLDFRNDVLPSDNTASTLGMPTTADLTSPLIILKFGIGVGQLPGGVTVGIPRQDLQNPVDKSFSFPPGMYPGQQLTVVFENYAVQGNIDTASGPEPLDFYGAIRLNIPQARVATSEVLLASADWHYTGGYNTNVGSNISGFNPNEWPYSNKRRGFVQVINETNGGQAVPANTMNDAENCVTQTMYLTMIWDGSVTKTWGAIENDSQVTPVPAQPYIPANNLGQVYTQAGWHVVSASTRGFLSGKNTIDGDIGRNTFIPFPVLPGTVT